jgi:hypothetical protein
LTNNVFIVGITTAQKNNWETKPTDKKAVGRGGDYGFWAYPFTDNIKTN